MTLQDSGKKVIYDHHLIQRWAWCWYLEEFSSEMRSNSGKKEKSTEESMQFHVIV